MTDATMTLRLSADLKQRLDRLSTATKRSRSFLANEAVTRFVESEEQIIEGILAAKADVEAGRVVSHDEAMQRLDAAIAQASKPQA